MLKRACGDQFFQGCHAIEGINGRGTVSENRFAQDLGLRLAAPSTGGSDAHRKEQLGTAATRFQRAITSLAELVQELQAGRFDPVDLRSGAESAPPRNEGGNQP